ncbi:response regulator [Flavobacterium sp.]|jgi:CheY-like chemotaxis protein|uniref:response regulator n=1 Tax=Flavobacterium sp. TaxID=239 RepID=UPI00391944BA
MKILIVEDNKIALMGIKKILSEYPNMEICTAENGLIALNLLNESESELPHFTLLDLNMPIMNGFEFLKEIKKKDNLRTMPVIIHTTSFNTLDVKMCEELGICGYFVKELDMVKYKSNIKLIADYWKEAKK